MSQTVTREMGQIGRSSESVAVAVAIESVALKLIDTIFKKSERKNLHVVRLMSI